MANCLSCEKELETVFPNLEGDEAFQFDNALWVAFYGGYGMFVESPEFVDETSKTITDSSYEALICHECAHKLCEENPWLMKLLKPESGHAHKSYFWKDNPDHVGWDNPKNGK